MSEAHLVERARFTPIDPHSGADDSRAVEVHFNPVSLQYTVTNTLENKGEGNNKKQYVSQSTGKLSMDLIFDTTPDGQDVRVFTEKVAGFMEPNDDKVPSIVLFEWGTYKFQGMVESYKETLDFFASGGVPLRAAISLTLSRQDRVFEPSATSRVDTQGSLQAEPIVVPTTPGGAGGAAETSRAVGNPRAARAIAAA